jgi:hypothetical protein
MIIRLTVNDNDFSGHLEHFATNLYTKLSMLTDKLIAATDDKDLMIQEHKNWQRTWDLLNPNITTEATITEEDKLWLAERVKLTCKLWFEQRVKDHFMEEDEALSVEDLEVTIGYDFKDMWENGEAVYYFSTANVIICQ